MPFIPLNTVETEQPATEQQGQQRGFIPLDTANDNHWYDPAIKTIKQIGQVYPVLESGASLASQGIALPVAGLSGLAAAGTNALGLTNADPSEVVRNVGSALTYQPQTEAGRDFNNTAMLPFQKLSEAGQYAGDKTLDATHSPALATAVDTAVNALPMAFGVRPETVSESVSRIINSGKQRAQQIINGGTKSADVPVQPVSTESHEAAGHTEEAPPITQIPPEQVPDHSPESIGVAPANIGEPPSGFTPTPEYAEELRNQIHNSREVPTDAQQIMGEQNDTQPVISPLDTTKPNKVSGMAGDEAHIPDDQVLSGALEPSNDLHIKSGISPVDAAAHDAATSPYNDLPNPTDGQIKEGNYRKGHVDIAGLNISIENPADSIRSGTDPNGNTWEIPMKSHYGYIRGTIGKDKEHIDAFIKPGTPADYSGDVYVIDQKKPGNGHFDEHKVVIGADSMQDAQTMYRSNYEAGWDGIYSAKAFTMPEFKEWLDNGDHQKPAFTHDDIEKSAPQSAPESVSGTSKFTPLSETDITEPSKGADSFVLGKNVRELDDAALNRWSGMKSLSSKARSALQDEIARRNAEKQSLSTVDKTAPVSMKVPAEGRQFGEVEKDVLRGSQAKHEKAVKELSDADYAQLDNHANDLMKQLAGDEGKQGALQDKIKELQGQYKGREYYNQLTNHLEELVKENGTSAEIHSTENAGDMAAQPGSAHVGFIKDQPSTIDSPTTFEKPLRREDVLAPLVKALNAPIYEGRIKGKKILGLYRPFAEMVRIKHSSDLEVSAHEIAHLLDDRIPEIKEAYRNNKDFRKELQSVSYDKTKLHEGFAEFVRLWMTQPEKAADKAPAFNGWFNDFIKRNEYGKAITEAQKGMTAWFDQDALARAQSKIGAKTIINDALGSHLDKFRQSVSDDLHGIYRMERGLTGETKANGAYESARLTRAAHSIADGAIRYGHLAVKEDGSFTYAGKGLEKILEPVADRLDDFLMYAVGESASELKGQGREHLFTTAEIEAMRALKQPGFEKAFQEYQTWNKGIVDFAESRGVINPASRLMWQRQSYMPFHRIGQPGEARSMKPGEWSGIKALTGGTDNLRPILGNMINNAVTLIDKAVKNEARQKVAALADEQRGGGRFMVKIPTESRPVNIDKTQVLNAVLKALGIEGKRTPEMAELAEHLKQQIAKSPSSFEFMMNGQSPAGNNVISLMREGRPAYYEVADPLLYRSLSALDRPHQSIWIKWLGLPKRIGQMSVTLTPDFMVRNIARDTIMGSIMSQHGFRPVVDSINGMIMRLIKDQNYKDYIANGGGLSSQFVDEGRFRHHLEKFYNQRGIDYRTVLDAPDKVLGFIEEVADAFEMSTRLGEYKRGIENGENPRHAAYLGRDVSTDFAMKGDSQVLGFIYDTCMFVRPMVESIDRLVRGVSHDPNRKSIAVKTGMLAMASMALYLHNKNNDEYNDLADWDKDNYWHFFIPGKDGQSQHYRFPKIWEIGAISSIAERTAERTIKEDPMGLGLDMARILGNLFSVNLIPQVIAPLYEQATNTSSFTGSKIETPGMDNLQPFMRAKHSTSETMKAAGMATRNMPEALQVNPTRAEALLRGYFNTWALYGLQAADSALYGDKLPEKRIDKYPVVGSFYEANPSTHSRYESMFYDLLGEANRLRGTLNELDKIGKSDIADEKEKNPIATKAQQMDRAANNLSIIEKDMEAVKRSDVSPQEKRQKIDALTVERNGLLKDTVLEVNPDAAK